MTDRPLLISSSLPLIDEVVRLASASALEVHVAPDIAAATPHWLSARDLACEQTRKGP